MAFGRHQRVDRERRRRAQDRADIVRIGDLIEHEDQAAGGNFGNVDGIQRARLEQYALVNGIARGARGNVVRRNDLCLDAARRDFRREALRRGRGRIETNEPATGRAQRRDDRVKAIETHKARVAPRRTAVWRSLGPLAAL